MITTYFIYLSFSTPATMAQEINVSDYNLKEIERYVWEMKQTGEMRVPGRIYGDNQIIDGLIEDVKKGKDWNALRQIRNVACLPGIQKASLAMSDVHPGYGFCIGGIGAFDMQEGVISVAGVGFDCNCGVRTLKTQLTLKDILDKKRQLADALFSKVPAGLGVNGEIRMHPPEVDEVLRRGARYAVEKGYGYDKDLEYIEERGMITGADPKKVSDKAKKRQFRQVGTLGSGNHYLEVQYVDEILDGAAAKAYGLYKDQIIVSIHCGSRALGHQIGTDYLQVLDAASKKYNIPIMERELVCAPIDSEEGRNYLSAVNCGINAAFANRQVISHLTRKAFSSVFGMPEEEIETFYEIGHNTAKVERHAVDGKQKDLLVLRKGATRAFGPGRDEVPAKYAQIGQPVLVGGTMGTSSYILHGTEKGMRDTFGSAIHGAGRLMSRAGAINDFKADDLVRDLSKKGIIVMGHSRKGLAEEAPGAYKDVDEVVDVMHVTDIARKVVKVRPLICIKG